MKKFQYPTADEIAAQLDLEAVANRIADSQQPISTTDFEDAKRMVWRLLENFVTRDVADLNVVAVEKHLAVGDGENALRGVTDVAAEVRSTPATNVLQNFANQVVIIDWKTSSKDLGTDWKDRLVDSWQWRMYAYWLRASLFIYRGVNTDEKTREILIQVPPTNDQEVEEYLAGGLAIRKALIDKGLEVWPRIMKNSTCGAFGKPCPYYDDCRNYTMPRQALGPKPMSYTQLENLFLCPERSRRMLIEEDTGESGSSLLGKAVHRGMEEIYCQLWPHAKMTKAEE